MSEEATTKQEPEQEPEQEQAPPSNQSSGNDYYVKFPFDFGRGFPELCLYWPTRKELRVEVKTADDQGQAIVMNPELMKQNPTDDMVYIWDATRFHRQWHDDNHLGKDLDPRKAPPGILNNKIPVPPGAEPSIKDQETEMVVDPQMQSEHESALQGTENGQHANVMMNGNPQVTPERVGNQPGILLDLATYNDYQTLIEIDGMVNETLMAILEQTVDPDSIEMSIVKIQRQKSQEIRGRLYADTSGQHSS